MSVVYSGTGTAVVCSGDYMYLANGKTIQKITLSTGVIDTPNWESVSIDILGMTIYNDYIYVVGNDAKIIQISLTEPPSHVTWATVGKDLMGISYSGDFMYVSNSEENGDGQVIQLNTSAEVTNTFLVDSLPRQICILDNYLYSAIGSDTAISRIDLTTNTVINWFNLPTSTYTYSTGIAAYGNYVYVSVAVLSNTGLPKNILQISLDGTKMTTFDTTYDSGYLYVYNEQLYALTTDGVVVFEIPPATDTLVYSQKDLDASSKATPMGKRGTVMLRRSGQRRPVAVLEMITRTSIFRRRKSVIYTTHHDCTITFLQHQSAVSGKFVNVNSTGVFETVTCMSYAASGRYTSAKLTITPNGNMREITVTP